MKNKLTKRQIVTVVLATIDAECLWACPAGCLSYEGNCACDLVAEQAAQTYKPSNEKPRRHPEPEWQTGEVKASLPSSLAEEDAKLDRESAQAEAEGRALAGIPLREHPHEKTAN